MQPHRPSLPRPSHHNNPFSSVTPDSGLGHSGRHSGLSTPQGTNQQLPVVGSADFPWQRLFDSRMTTYHSCMSAYLQLVDPAWKRCEWLREHGPTRDLLNGSFANFYDIPDEVWRLLTQMRSSLPPERLQFYAMQLNLAAQNDFSQEPSQPMDPFASPYNGRRFSPLPNDNVIARTPGNMEAFPITRRLSQSPRSDSPTAPGPTNMSGAKEAPAGFVWKCPSRGCKHKYKRLGHYHNHVTRKHPDFYVAHPEHVPDDALTPEEGSHSSIPPPPPPPPIVPTQPVTEAPAVTFAEAGPATQLQPGYVTQPQTWSHPYDRWQ